MTPTLRYLLLAAVAAFVGAACPGAKAHTNSKLTLAADFNLGPTGSGPAEALAGNVTSLQSGAGSTNGNATNIFGSTAITGFSLSFTNPAGAPRYHYIAIGDMIFTPIPEVDPAVPAIVLCVAAVLFAHLRKRRV